MEFYVYGLLALIVLFLLKKVVFSKSTDRYPLVLVLGAKESGKTCLVEMVTGR